MNKVQLFTFTFSDADGTLAQGATATTYFSPIGNELRAAEYKIPIVYVPRIYQETADDFAKIAQNYYGAPVYLYENGQQTGFFYLTAVTGGTRLQNGRYAFTLKGTDLAGMYASRSHSGGIYSGSLAGNILRSILGSDNFELIGDKVYCTFSGGGYIIPAVALERSLNSESVSGWLPYTNDARDNLRLLLQRLNATITFMRAPLSLIGQEGNLIPLITSSQDAAAQTISPYRTYSGDGYERASKIAQVSVQEHGYLALASTAAETLYQETGTASRKLVTFERPMHSLDGGGLTINQRSANFAVVSGTGTLTGKPYIDTVRQLSESLGSLGDGITIDNTLIDPLNSEAMLERAAHYYQLAKPLKSDFAADDSLGAGAPVIVEDPLGSQVAGYIEEQTATFSCITKLANRIAAGWYPVSGAVFTEMQTFAESGTLTVPEGVKLLRLILIQGGTGGWGGYKGGNATHSSIGGPDETPGDGGAPGEGGSAGKVNIVDIEAADLAESYTITVGAPGSPGAADHGAGTPGGHSTASDGTDTYTSADGDVPTNGISNPMTGEALAINGSAGIYDGGSGVGPGTADPITITDTETGVTGNTTWRSGTSRAVSGGAHGGGGPAYGANGQNAGSTYAGDGADAALDGFNGYTAEPAGGYGSGGIGGNGGGGGGASTDRNVSGGSGGHGSPGGPAAGGAVLALMSYGSNPLPTPTPNWLFDATGEPLYDYYYERLAAQEE